MRKKYKVNYQSQGEEEDSRRFNYVFLLIFFGLVILIQVIGIILRNFQSNILQLVGIGIGLIGYVFILRAYIKYKKNQNKIHNDRRHRDI